MKKIIMISTPLPPHPCGQGNYTAMLRNYWPEDGTQIIHLVTDGATKSREYLGTNDIYEFQGNYGSLVTQLNRFPKADILLQYAGRGYNRFGCPYWLPLALQQWRRKHPDQVLVVMFHELWTSLQPWKKHFFTENINCWITKQLISLATNVCCLTPHQTARLKALSPGINVDWIPVGSNIPPIQVVDADFARRSRKEFLIFGLQYTRIILLKKLSNELTKLHQNGILEKLHLIGPMEAKWDFEEKKLLKQILPSHVVNYHGVLPPEKVSHLLHRVGFCIIGQPPENLTKASSFMAFASHGCCILSPYTDLHANAPVCYLTHPNELLHNEINSIDQKLVERGQNLLRWYYNNADWSNNVAKIAKIFHSSKGKI